ncbi:hypothetical protein CEP54_009450 [Fusarium duplospermum]|uniref:2EXR domain-containing protein n=1 Tax=Fusarium duplospermum TaxID=1325734 RepID=A0A428PQ65_9HYPO|nr:hypothetical protein CEP54_009450 [Fusarium duplospermum]
MATTFDRFSDLPRELRDEIWRFAIRTTHPGVHIFRLRNDFKRDYTGTCDSLSLSSFLTGRGLVEPLRGRYFRNIDTNRSQRNVSTYLIDGGLWTVCKESRLVIEKYFKSLELDYLGGQQNTGPPERRYMPATGYFMHSGGAPHYFTVISYRDLFVLKPNLLGKPNGYRADLKMPARLREVARHIAMEYKPEWGTQLRNVRPRNGMHPIIKELVSFANNYWNMKLWLIDHNLKRKKDVPPFEEDTRAYSINAFYASDRKFLAVERDSEGPNLDHWQRIHQGGGGDSDESSRFFLSSLLKEVDEEDRNCFGLLGWDDL